jgi:hypothetical protein
VFVGASNLAQRWWCAQYSLLAARDEELMFFANYLYNGVEYAGLLRAEPQAEPACQLAKQTRGVGESGRADQAPQGRGGGIQDRPRQGSERDPWRGRESAKAMPYILP